MSQATQDDTHPPDSSDYDSQAEESHDSDSDSDSAAAAPIEADETTGAPEQLAGPGESPNEEEVDEEEMDDDACEYACAFDHCCSRLCLSTSCGMGALQGVAGRAAGRAMYVSTRFNISLTASCISCHRFV